MIRAMLLLTVGTAAAACSGEQPAGKSPVGGDGSAGRAAVHISAQGADAEKGGSAVMSNDEILISFDGGHVRAQLADNESARALAKMLPLEIRMRDHLRQEKTGVLPSALPAGERQTDFSVGTLGLWGDRDFVIYCREGRVPAPGIVILGQVKGDLSIFDNPQGVTVSLRRPE